MVNPGSDSPSSGREYPSLENSPPPVEPNAPVNYPPDATLPTYPGSFDSSPPAAPPGYPQASYPPPGYPPPAAPYPGYPPYPGPYPPQNSYGYDPYARPVGTNGKAIASLVTSVVGLGLYGLPSVVGLILGIIAMRETKRTGQEGHGLALAGVIVGALSVVGWLIVLVIFIFFVIAVGSHPSYY